jgi:hypothetical protein
MCDQNLARKREYKLIFQAQSYQELCFVLGVGRVPTEHTLHQCKSEHHSGGAVVAMHVHALVLLPGLPVPTQQPGVDVWEGSGSGQTLGLLLCKARRTSACKSGSAGLSG